MLLHAPDLREEADPRGPRADRGLLRRAAGPSRRSPSTTASGFTDEPQVGPRGADHALRGPRGAVRCLVPGPVRREAGSRTCSRPSRRSPCRSAWSSTTRGSCARRGRCDEHGPRLPDVLRGGGDLDDRRGEARRPGDAGHPVCGAGRVRGLLSLSPQAREAHRGRRARRRMVGAPRGREHHDELARTPAARLGSRRADRQH